MAGKFPRAEDDVIILFSQSEMEHVTCPHDDVLVITEKTMVNSMNVLFLDALKNMGKTE